MEVSFSVYILQKSHLYTSKTVKVKPGINSVLVIGWNTLPSSDESFQPHSFILTSVGLINFHAIIWL